MNKEILYGIGGLVIGVLITFITSNTVNKNNTSVSQEHMMTMDHNSMTMSDMTASLQGKTGDEFDKLFISEMIVHHQGAIDMAKLAQKNAGHDEVKELADDIITAQTNEIEQMKQWQQEWGY